ncbi:MAG: thiamine pyrophosphate-dependent enzyme, partial [Chloroflexota bacterium]
AAVPDDGVAIGDMCGIVYTGTALWQSAAERSWHYAGGFCTLGCAMPMGIGAKLAMPEVPMVVMVGDAGFQFTSTELATAYEQRLPLPIIIWNNDGLGAIEGHMDNMGVQRVAVEYGSSNPDFLALAKAYHCHAERPQSLAELTQAVERAFTADRPTVIEVLERIDW